MLVFCVPMKNGKRLACDTFYSFAKHASLVHDVTDSDTVMQTAGHSSHGHVFLPLSNMDFEQRGSQVKNCCVYIFGFHSLLFGSVVLLWFDSPLIQCISHTVTCKVVEGACTLALAGHSKKHCEGYKTPLIVGNESSLFILSDLLLTY